MNNFKYIVFNSSEQHILNLNELLIFCADPIRKSSDEIHSYVKYYGVMPQSVASLSSRSQEYTREQIQALIVNENWNTPVPF